MSTSAIAQLEPLGELRHVVREQHGLPGRAERQSDVGRADHLAGQLAESLPDLRAEDGATELAKHAGHRARQLLGLGRQGAAHRTGDVLGHGVDDLLPDRQGVLHPLRPAPGRGGGGRLRQRGDRVEPVLGQPDGVGDVVGIGRGHRPVPGGGDGLAGDVLGEVPVDRVCVGRAAEQLLDLREDRVQVGDAACAGRTRELLEHRLERSSLERVVRFVAHHVGLPVQWGVRLQLTGYDVRFL
jgi:hypothetical protein